MANKPIMKINEGKYEYWYNYEELSKEIPEQDHIISPTIDAWIIFLASAGIIICILLLEIIGKC